MPRKLVGLTHFLIVGVLTRAGRQMLNLVNGICRFTVSEVFLVSHEELRNIVWGISHSVALWKYFLCTNEVQHIGFNCWGL